MLRLLMLTALGEKCQAVSVITSLTGNKETKKKKAPGDGNVRVIFIITGSRKKEGDIG